MRILFAALLCCMLPFSAVGQSTNTFTADDVFDLEWASDPQISPDGERVVYKRMSMDKMKDRRQSRLWVVGTNGDSNRKLTGMDVSESSPRWSPDGSRVAFTAGTDEGSEIYVYDFDTGMATRLTQLNRSPSGLRWSPDGEHIAFSMLVPEDAPSLDAEMPDAPKNAEWADKPRVLTRLRHQADGRGYLEPGYDHLFVIPTEGGAARQITTEDFHHRSAPTWLPDGSGLIFSADRSDDWAHDRRESELYRVDLKSDAITQLTDRDGPDYAPAVSPDGSKIAFLGFDDQVQTFQNTQLYIQDLDDSNRRSLTADLDKSISSATWAADGNGLYVSYLESGDTKVAYIGMDGETQEITGNVGGTSIGRPYTGGSFSVSDDGIIAFTHATSERPADVATVQADASPSVITALNKDLLPHRTLGEVEELTWTSADGRSIQGWVVRPPNFDADETYPLLLEIHGGPITSYGPTFSAEIQLYAAAGYVVLYANPRGSTGYGQEFANLLYHDYPGGDYGDLMTGVDAAIETGSVDTDQLYVTGGSAGGTMTAWIVGKTNRFRAAVVTKPVMNWYSKTLVADNYYGYAHYRYPGYAWENPEKYLEESPISLAGQIETPTMTMVGSEDLRTPPSEALQLYHALKIRQIETAHVEIPGASHHIASRPSQLAAKVAYTLAWFKRYR
ncbi:peptidase S9 family protein [Longibacter salinarum]|uniref:Peptidase S9 family protein n=1 Tax=Longibacter salinarum TaxID=1850348 RepID=A0A2A8CWB0_9BACT|nr:S9 family peptidase [Longibacter salinarum]PEN12936.1 peptidase S9 family protein [Longibacter salinarum]